MKQFIVIICLSCTHIHQAKAVEIQPTVGAAWQGDVVGFEQDQVVLRAADKEQSVPYANVRHLHWTRPSNVPAEAPGIQITLSDGGRVMASSYVVAQGIATIGSSLGEALTIPTKQITAVYWGSRSDKELAAWQTIIDKPVVADRVVVLRKDGAIDPVPGVLEDLDSEQIAFRFDNEMMKVRRSKAIGIAYYHPPQENVPPARGSLSFHDGSQLPVVSLRYRAKAADDAQQALVDVQTVNGLQLSLPLRTFAHLDLASTSLVYLSDLEPETAVWQPFVNVPAIEPSLQAWFRVHRDSEPAGFKIRLRTGGHEQVFAKGLTVHSRAEQTFRLAGQYRRFQALAGIDPVVGGGDADLIVRVDGQVAWKQRLSAGAEAMVIDIDVTRANRLTVIVDYGDSSDVGDLVQLGDARLIK